MTAAFWVIVAMLALPMSLALTLSRWDDYRRARKSTTTASYAAEDAVKAARRDGRDGGVAA